MLVEVVAAAAAAVVVVVVAVDEVVVAVVVVEEVVKIVVVVEVVVVVLVAVVVAHGSWSLVSVLGVRLLSALQLHLLGAEHDSNCVRVRATPVPHPVLTVVQVEG